MRCLVEGRDRILFAPDDQNGRGKSGITGDVRRKRRGFVSKQARLEPIAHRGARAFHGERPAIEFDTIIGDQRVVGNEVAETRPIISGLVKVVAMSAVWMGRTRESNETAGPPPVRFFQAMATSSNTSPLMRSGDRNAVSTVAPPPKEWPTRSKRCSSSASAKARCDRPGLCARNRHWTGVANSRTGEGPGR